MIYNDICQDCDKLYVCKIRDKLNFFKKENKENCIDIKIEDCKEYVKIE